MLSIFLHLSCTWLLKLLLLHPKADKLFIHAQPQIVIIMYVQTTRQEAIFFLSFRQQQCRLHFKHFACVTFPHIWHFPFVSLLLNEFKCSVNSLKLSLHSVVSLPRGNLTSRYMAYKTRNLLSSSFSNLSFSVPLPLFWFLRCGSHLRIPRILQVCWLILTHLFANPLWKFCCTHWLFQLLQPIEATLGALRLYVIGHTITDCFPVMHWRMPPLPRDVIYCPLL